MVAAKKNQYESIFKNPDAISRAPTWNGNNKFANVNLLEDEYGISPGQACVFYSKNNEGYKVLGGGWVKK